LHFLVHFKVKNEKRKNYPRGKECVRSDVNSATCITPFSQFYLQIANTPLAETGRRTSNACPLVCLMTVHPTIQLSRYDTCLVICQTALAYTPAAGQVIRSSDVQVVHHNVVVMSSNIGRFSTFCSLLAFRTWQYWSLKNAICNRLKLLA